MSQINAGKNTNTWLPDGVQRVNRVRVLFVDDDEEDFLLTRYLLHAITTMMCDTTWVTDAEQAMEHLMHGAYDVCLLDYRLGAETGLDLLHRLGTHAERVPIILLTGQGDHAIDVQAMEAGAADYLSKGEMSPPLLERSIRYAIRHAETIRRLRASEAQYRAIVAQQEQAQQELSASVERLTTLQRIDHEVTDTLDMNYVVAMALDIAVRLSRAAVGFLAVQHSAEEADLTLVQVIGADPATYSQSYQDGIVGRVLRSGEAALVTDVSVDPDYNAVRAQTRAQMTIPLRVQERITGVLNLEADHAQHFTVETFEFLQHVMARVAVSLENARLYQVARDRLQEMERLYEQVSELENLKTDMIRIAAHDLRNPLSALVGYIDLLSWDRDLLTPRHREYLAEMENAGQRMETIINDVLSLERIEQRAKTANYTSVNMQQLVSGVYVQLAAQAQQKSQDLEVLSPLPALEVWGDETQLHEALFNLMSNAIKYTPEGGRIRMVLEAADGQGVIRIEDNGYGIPKEAQGRLFEAFYRVTTEETRMIDGTGLGLHLVRNVVQRHGGEIIFHSVYGEGSTFGFALPLIDGDAAN